MGKGDLGLQSSGQSLTPNIDELAAQSRSYDKFYTVSPICSPSRVSFFTGEYPSTYAIHSFIHDQAANRKREMNDYLQTHSNTLARLTKNKGYATAHIGKWHMGGGRDIDYAPKPTEYGFDSSYVSFEGLGDRLLFSNHQNKLSARSAALKNGNIDWQPKDKTSEIYVDKSIAFIEKSVAKQQPFYLQLWLNDVHDPHMPKGDFSHLSYQQRFHLVLKEMDQQLGRLFDKIQSTPALQNTLIVFTSDNGPVATKKYYRNNQTAPGNTKGLRGRKWSLYEGGINMPFFVYWPNNIPAGNDTETLLTSIDLLPSIAGLLNTPVNNVKKVDGIDLHQSWLKAKPIKRERPVYFEYASTGQNFRHMKPHLSRDKSPELAVREGDWKLLMTPNGQQIELYNMAKDPFETTDVSKQQRQEVEQLSRKLATWRSKFPNIGHRVANDPRIHHEDQVISN